VSFTDPDVVEKWFLGGSGLDAGFSLYLQWWVRSGPMPPFVSCCREPLFFVLRRSHVVLGNSLVFLTPLLEIFASPEESADLSSPLVGSPGFCPSGAPFFSFFASFFCPSRREGVEVHTEFGPLCAAARDRQDRAQKCSLDLYLFSVFFSSIPPPLPRGYQVDRFRNASVFSCEHYVARV